MMDDDKFDKLMLGMTVTAVQAAAVATIWNEVPKPQLFMFFCYGLLSCWLAHMTGDRTGFRRGMKVMEGLR